MSEKDMRYLFAFVGLLVAAILFSQGWKLTSIEAGPFKFEQRQEATPNYSSSSKPSNDQSGGNAEESAAIWENMGTNTYNGSQLNLNQFPRANSDQIYVFHGDILGENRCKIWIIYPGGKPTDYSPSHASWQLIRITGTENQRQSELYNVQDGAAAHANTGTCPILN